MEPTNQCRSRKCRSHGDSSLDIPPSPSASSASSSAEKIKITSGAVLVPIFEHPEDEDHHQAPPARINVRRRMCHASGSSEISPSVANPNEGDDGDGSDYSDISWQETRPDEKRKIKRKHKRRSHKIKNTKLESKPKIVDFEAEYLKEYRTPKPECPQKNCKCQMCYVLNMTEDESEDVSTEDEGRDAFAACWDIKPLASKRGIRIRIKNALAEGIPLTAAEEFQRQEDLEHQKFLDFVNPFEKKMCEARAARSEPWIWDAIFEFSALVYSYAYERLTKCDACKAGVWNLLSRVCYVCSGICEQWREFRKKHSAKVNFVNLFENDGVKDNTDVTAKSVIIDMQSTSLRTRYF